MTDNTTEEGRARLEEMRKQVDLDMDAAERSLDKRFGEHTPRIETAAYKDGYVDCLQDMRLLGNPPLPTDEEGFIQTSASYGETWLVKIEYNTDFDGREIDPGKEEYPCTLHGEFFTPEEAAEWMDAYPDGDTDIHDMTVVPQNRVRP